MATRKGRTGSGRFKRGWTITKAGRAVKCKKGAAGKRSACYTDGTAKHAGYSRKARVRRKARRPPSYRKAAPFMGRGLMFAGRKTRRRRVKRRKR